MFRLDDALCRALFGALLCVLHCVLLCVALWALVPCGTVYAQESSTDVFVLGMTHSRHLESESWGLEQVEQVIRAIDPDVVCVEIPPDRWPRVWSDYRERGVIEDSRVQRFPEYTEVLLPLAVELGFEVEPCAAWTREMADSRRSKVAAFREEERFADQRAEWNRRELEIQARYTTPLGEIDDPHLLHSEHYDRRVEEELSLYDEYLNDWIGAGGWTNINEAHMKLIDGAIERHRGKRFLITFGAGHKYWFLDRLRQRKDVRLLDVTAYLPAPNEEGTKMIEACRREVVELHTFFQDWFNGTLGRSDEQFERFAGVMADDFELISPRGEKLTRASLVDGLKSAHGRSAKSPMKVWVEDVRVREVRPGLWLSTYQEWQKFDGQTKGRLSSAVFERSSATPNGVVWRHVHEVWLPESGE